jgi:hypothetical protein
MGPKGPGGGGATQHSCRPLHDDIMKQFGHFVPGGGGEGGGVRGLTGSRTMISGSDHESNECDKMCHMQKMQ